MADANTVTARISFQVTALEELGATNTPSAPAASRRVTHSDFNFSPTTNPLTASSDPPVSKVAGFLVTLADSAGEIDLTALTGTNGATVDATGLRLQALLIEAASDNSAVVNIAPGAANGYDLFGASGSVDIAAGAAIAAFLNDAGSNVGASECILDLAGTTGDVVNVLMVLG